MQYFNFSRLINKYKSEFSTISVQSGYWDDAGDWVEAETKEVTLQGAIIKHNDVKIRNSNGTLTAKDLRLFTLDPIDKALLNGQVVYEDNTYSIEDERENAKFTGVYSYTLKYVSAFDKKKQGVLNDDVERLEKRLDGEKVD